MLRAVPVLRAVTLAPRGRSVSALTWLTPVVLAVASRLVFLSSPAAALDPDEAATRLMAERIMQGAGYVFFPGQAYMGSLEQYLQAGVLTVLPDNDLTLRLVQVALAAVACLLVHRLALVIFGSRFAAALAATLFAVGPYFSLERGSRSYGAYSAAQVAGAAGLLFAVLLARAANSGAPGRRRAAYAGGLGLCCGLGIWLTPVVASVLLPAGLFAAATLVRRWRLLAAFTAGLVAGMAPLLGYAAGHRVVPMPAEAALGSTLWERVGLLSGPTLREYLGLSGYADEPVVPRVLAVLVVLALLVAYGVAAAARRRGLLAVLTLREAGREPVDLLLVAVPVVAVCHVASPFTWYANMPRYLFVTYPLLALLLTGLVMAVPRPRRTVVAGALLVIVAALSLGTVAARWNSGSAGRDAELAALGRGLLARGETHLYADYFTAMPLQSVTGGIDGPVRAAPRGPGRERFPELARDVDADPHPVYVSGSPREEQIVRTALSAHGVRFGEWRVGRYVVFDQLSPVVRPPQVGLQTPM